MKRIILAVILAVALLRAQRAKAKPAYPNSLQELLSACEEKDSQIPFGYCVGATHAIYKGFAYGRVYGNRACLPDFVTSGQLIQVFINFAKSRPDIWLQQALQHVAWSFALAWPCK